VRLPDGQLVLFFRICELNIVKKKSFLGDLKKGVLQNCDDALQRNQKLEGIFWILLYFYNVDTSVSMVYFFVKGHP